MDEVKPVNGFLQDINGDSSSKRLESFVCLTVAILLSAYQCIWKVDISRLVDAFLVASAGFQGVSAVADTFMKKF